MGKRVNKIILFSLAISLILHGAFFSLSGKIWLKGVSETLEGAKRLFDVKLIEETKPLVRSIISKASGYDMKLRFEKPVSETTAGADEKFASYLLKKEKDETRLAGFETPERPLEMPDRKAVDMAERTGITEERRAVRRSVAEEPEVFFGEGDVLPKAPAAEIVPKEFAEEMPGFTPLFVAPGRFSKSPARMPRGESAYTGLDEYLVADLVTYEDPSDGGKYFKITITTGRDADKLPVLPKEIIFLIDCSLSIQGERMENFKKGLLRCLNRFGRDDVFNIISFKETIQRLSAEPLAPSQDNIRVSGEFIAGLRPGNTTDVFRAVQAIIKSPPKKKPSYVMLLSDGKPTVGTTDPMEIISQISRINEGRRPIFCYSGGARVDRYLLDFIAYRNRGWSEYSQRSFDITKGLPAFYNKIKDPLLLNLRYRFSRLSAEEVYPKTLPDFYKGAAFTIYGKYEDEDEFSMQLLGDSKDVTMEFIFTDSLGRAQKGGKEIARQWAFNKIYYLIGKLADKKQDPAVIDEINSLCQKFRIRTPYTGGVR